MLLTFTSVFLLLLIFHELDMIGTPYLVALSQAVSFNKYVMPLNQQFIALFIAALSAVSRLVFSASTCLAVPVLRHKQPLLKAQQKFRLAGGAVIPLLAASVCIWLLTGSSRSQALLGLGAVVSGALIYVISRRLSDW